MNVLFVSSGNSLSNSVDNLTLSQGNSLIEKGIHIDYFTIKGKGLKGYIKNIAPLKHQLRSKKYSIIHAHYGLCGIVSWFASLDQKLVVSFMGDDLLGSVNNSGTYSIKSKLISFTNRIFGWFAYDHCIVKSQNLYKKLLSKKKASVIPNGVNYDIFFPYDKTEARAKLNMQFKKHIILFVADPERNEKNFRLAKDSVNELNDPTIALLPIHNVSQPVLNDHYNASDLVLLTSIHEGSPNVIKEAMACNIPIVATNVGDVKTNIGQTEGCYIVSMDKKEIASKIKDSLKLNSRTSGRANIEHLRIDKVADRIINIYTSIL